MFELLKQIFVAWRYGSPWTRAVLITAFSLGSLAAVILVTANLGFSVRDWVRVAAGTLAAIAGVAVFIILGFQSVAEQNLLDNKIEEAEKRAEQHPQEPRAAWDLARVKLEQYVDRNLKQVRSIFWLSILVMGMGFALIGYGVIMVFADPQNFNASIVTAGSGILINFIGATFLLIYRSTMEQAKDYVSVLERINAVGMSVQILEQIDDTDPTLKNQTTADIAKQLLALYGTGR